MTEAPPEARDDPRRPKHFEAGDGLRAISCLAVALFHVSVASALRYGDFSPRFHDSYGQVFGGFIVGLRCSVPIFLSLSGYLVGGPFVRAWVEGRRMPGLSKYARRRILRIGPAFWVVLVYMLIRHESSHPSAPHMLSYFAFLHTEFPTNFMNTYGQQLWTVDVEAFFYVAAPLLAVGLIALWPRIVRGGSTEGRRRAFAVVGLLLMAVGSIFFAGHYDTEGAVGKSLLAWWVAFVPGILLAVMEVPARTLLPGTRLGKGLSFGALLMALAAFVLLGRMRPTLYYLVPTADIIGGSFLVVSAMIWQWTTNTAWRPLVSRPLAAVGRWSFGIYLWHISVLYELLRIVPAHKFTPPVQVAIMIVPLWGLSIALGALSWRFIEAPLVRRGRKPVPAEAAVLA